MERSGLILVDKPKGITSYDVIRLLKGFLSTKKIGHTGTLDPIATGLLIILIGNSTKLANHFIKQDKVYRFTIKLGQDTDTMDSTGKIIKEGDYKFISKERFGEAIKSFIGEIEQFPPMFSAVKFKGMPLYKYARRGEAIDVKPRVVKVFNIAIDEFNLPYVMLTSRVSSGTYIRALAKSIGDVVGCYAHVTDLTRLSIGELKLENAFTANAIGQMSKNNDFSFIIPMERLVSNIKDSRLFEEKIRN
ncbi:MAG: tRNA pseudouridine(55) synthase TruB [Deltaproteobacteria bacterium]|nr:tRNA pseudouridine(55) synthase TruB [Deltaproteobacteria bacterium]MCL5792991.1 tRNA pseudouridine(55) synthase TruB [Deltaproteobacteria bacterium]